MSQDYTISHLDQLESEAIFVLRETAAQFNKPVLLFSGGKDSIVMAYLAKKAFWPAKLPFPLMHVDTGHNFPETLEFRDTFIREIGADLDVASVQKAIDEGKVVEEKGVDASRNSLQTVALLEGLEEGGYDAALGGGRRDEEKSRAKERVFSHRDARHQWDAKNQRPELWNLYNARLRKGEEVRVFPLSNWTELDVWMYILKESIPVVPLYLARERPVVEREGTWIMVDDDRMRLAPDEEPQMRRIRFRTLGCYPLTGGIDSDATTLEAVIGEMLASRFSERQGRLIDNDEEASMEKKKQDGYF